jgi:hypothetical protein
MSSTQVYIYILMYIHILLETVYNVLSTMKNMYICENATADIIKLKTLSKIMKIKS